MLGGGRVRQIPSPVWDRRRDRLYCSGGPEIR